MEIMLISQSLCTILEASQNDNNFRGRLKQELMIQPVYTMLANLCGMVWDLLEKSDHGALFACNVLLDLFIMMYKGHIYVTNNAFYRITEFLTQKSHGNEGLRQKSCYLLGRVKSK